jgi:hypothetical protein
MKTITVARFPIGSWTTGGPVEDPDYENCEVYSVPLTSREAATKKAQGIRRRLVAKGLSLPTQSNPHIVD